MKRPLWLGGQPPAPTPEPEPFYVFHLADLPPYSFDDLTCPKCTCGRIRDEYRAQRKWFNKIEPEHMRRICDDCGFTWRERCVDAEVSQS